jgi:flagellar hook assembly protein FlgD
VTRFIDEQGRVIIRNNIINPRKGETVFLNFNLDKRSKVSITVYDLAGNPVKTLYNGSANPGMNEVTWDGKSRRGKPVVRGVYYVLVLIDKSRHVRKVLVVR